MWDQRGSEEAVYAIVRAGGRQEKVSVGDVVTVDRLTGSPGDTVTLKPVLVVDGSTVTSSAAELAGVTVTARIVDELRGPKLRIVKFKNKTGYRRRQGHRQELTRIRIDSIGK
jgi:large subunit ribosomal protein L21